MSIAAEPLRSSSRLVQLSPMVVIQAYLLFTVLVFALGPWEWKVASPWTFYGYLASAHTALILGYLLGIRGRGVVYRGRFSPQRLVLASVTVALVLAMPTSQFRTGNLIPDVLGGIQDPGAAYEHSGALRFHLGRTPVVEYIRFLFGPLLTLSLPLGIFFWKDLGRLTRSGVVLAALVDVATFVAAGTNKAIADLVLLFPSVVYATYASGRLRLSRKAVLGAILATLVGFTGFVIFFANGAASRGEGGGSAVNGVFPQVDVRADMNHPLLRELPPMGQVGFLGLSLYFSVGYQALAMSLEEPWVPCFGIGNSYFLQRQAIRITGNDNLSRYSYPSRLEKRGWDAEGLWSSIYPWIASDVSFPGSILVIFLIGWLFGKVWTDVLVGMNPFAVALFSQMTLMLFYFPANNQLMQSGEGLSAFLITMLCWRWTRAGAAGRDPEGGVHA